MRIEIENGKLVDSINYLYGLKLARKQSRFRRRLINQLKERLKVYEEDRKELLEEHSNKDAEGNAIIDKAGKYDVKDLLAYQKDLKELDDEIMVIEGGDNREMIRTVQKVLRKYEEEEYEGKESEAYDYLCEQFGIDEEVQDAGEDEEE